MLSKSRYQTNKRSVCCWHLRWLCWMGCPEVMGKMVGELWRAKTFSMARLGGEHPWWPCFTPGRPGSHQVKRLNAEPRFKKRSSLQTTGLHRAPSHLMVIIITGFPIKNTMSWVKLFVFRHTLTCQSTFVISIRLDMGTNGGQSSTN